MVVIIIILYSALLFWISRRTARAQGSFYSANKKAPWPVVAYGMVGASISGVTFVSVPGNVLAQNFYYLPMVLGFVGGYVLIAHLLLPLYYRMNVTSIYTYLGQRFGEVSHKTGSLVFMVSRVLGAAVRLFVAVLVLYSFVAAGGIDIGTSTLGVSSAEGASAGVSVSTSLGASSWVSVLNALAAFVENGGGFALLAFAFVLLLYLYTYRGGVKTIIWTDVLQTTCMLVSVLCAIVFVCRQMGWNFAQMWTSVLEAANPAVEGTKFVDALDWNWSSGTNVVKQFVSGLFVTVAMTGLDQAMMQKNLACRDIRSAQKNMYTTAGIIVVVNCFFLLLGAVLSIFASSKGLTLTKTDELFPTIASQYLGPVVAVLFLIGMISASYPSLAATLTSLTSSFCVDFLGFNGAASAETQGISSSELSRKVRSKERMRKLVQAVFALLLFAIVMLLFAISNDAVINLIYKLASYTYGPLLGMFFFGILTRLRVRDCLVPVVVVAAPLICLLLNILLKATCGFDLGFSLLIVNGLLTFVGMWVISLGSHS